MARMKSTAPIMAANQAALGARKNASGTAITKSTSSSRKAGSVAKPSRSPRSELKVALKSRFKGDPANRAFGKRLGRKLCRLYVADLRMASGCCGLRDRPL